MTTAAPAAQVDEGVCSERGRRPHNEDSYATYRLGAGVLELSPELLSRKGYLYVVADGMGGHDAGDVASAIAVQTLCATFYNSPVDEPVGALREAVEAANRAIFVEAQRRGSSSGRPMGTTVVCAVVHGETVTFCHVGDSRGYHLGQDGVFHTTDHDWISTQSELRGLPEREARNRARAIGMSGRLMRAVGVQPGVRADVTVRPWRRGDLLLLCSDGLHSVLSGAQIAHIVRSVPAAEAARALVAQAYTTGSGDNITALVVRNELVPGTPLKTRLVSPERTHPAPQTWGRARTTALRGVGLLLAAAALIITISWAAWIVPPAASPPATVGVPTDGSPTADGIAVQATATPRMRATQPIVSTPASTVAPLQPPATATPTHTPTPPPTATATATAVEPSPTSTVEPSLTADPATNGLVPVDGATPTSPAEVPSGQLPSEPAASNEPAASPTPEPILTVAPETPMEPTPTPTPAS